MRIIWIPFFMVVCVACKATAEIPAVTHATLIPTTVPSLLSTISLSLTPSPSATPIATLTITPALSPTSAFELEPINPTLVSLCPENRLVALHQLGLNSQTRLVVLPWTVEEWDEIGYSLISPTGSDTEQVPNLIPERMVNRAGYYHINNNGQWVVYNLQEKENLHEAAWISSLDGKQQWTLSPTKEFKVGFWLDPESVILYDQEQHPLKIVNPFTLEEENLTNLPPIQVEGIGAIFFRESGHTYLLYQSGYEIHLLDLDQHTDHLAFRWLNSEESSYSDLNFFQVGEKFFVTVKRDYGFDMSSELNTGEITSMVSYTRMMQPILLPEGILSAEPFELSPSGQAMMIYLKEDQQISFYRFDYESNVIDDYCYDAMDSRASVSPDGKFIAFTRFYFPSSRPVPKSIFIINLETGYMSQINGYQFVGWGQLP